MAGSKGSKYYDIFLKYDVDLYSKENNYQISDDFIKILKEIDDTNSIKTTADNLNISYRKAWGDINKAESFFGFKFVEKQRGGKDGGRTRLTENGVELMNAFNELHQEFDQAISKISKRFFNKLNK